MSVTILKTLGSWQAVRAQDRGTDARTPLRGRVITGLLTIDERSEPSAEGLQRLRHLIDDPDPPAVAPDP
jgi:hypothetical protein